MFSTRKREYSNARAEPVQLKRAPIAADQHAAELNSAWYRLATRVPTRATSAVGGSRIQPKLTVGAPNDEYEQEADRVADQVMRMPEPGIRRKPG